MSIRNQLRPGESGVDGRWTDVLSAYDEQIAPIQDKYNQFLASETGKLENDYTMRSNRQNNLTRSISRFSPIYVTSSLMAEFSGTGYSEVDHFLRQANVFQEYVKQNYYDKVKLKIYRDEGGYMSRWEEVENLPTELPTIENYKSVSIGQIFLQNWVDIALLCFYGILFFVCAFISFLRFDVR